MSIGFQFPEPIKGLTFNNKELNRALSVYASLSKRKMADVLKDQTRKFCIDLCDYFPPFSGSAPATHSGGEGGFGNRARNKGREAVNRDIRHIFEPIAQAPAGDVAAKGNHSIFAAWLNAKMKLPEPHYPEYIFSIVNKKGVWLTAETEWDYFRQIEKNRGKYKCDFLLTPSDTELRKEHFRIRHGKNIRVNKGQSRERYFVDDWKAVERYIKKTQQRVGKLKSGWYAAGEKLGKMPTSAWIRDQGSATSVFVPMLQGNNPKITIGNTIARDHSQGWHFFSKARDHRHYSLRVALYHMFKSSTSARKVIGAKQAIVMLEKQSNELK